MMMMPAARSKSRLSGIFTIEAAGSAIFSRAPLWPQDATTRSPALRSVTPAPTLSTTPAISAAGENGKGGFDLDHQDVEEIQRRCLDRDHGLAGTGHGIRHVGQHEVVGLAKLRAENGFH